MNSMCRRGGQPDRPFQKTLYSADTNGCYHQTAIVQSILAGGQTDHLVAVLGGQARVVEAQLLAGGDKLVKLLLVGSVLESLIGKALAQVGCGLENGKNLVGMVLHFAGG